MTESKWQRRARLRPTDALQMVAVAAQLLRAECLLRLRPIDRVAAHFDMRFHDAAGDLGPLVLTAQEHRWLTNARRILGRWPLDRSCLRRSLVLGWVLRSRDPELVVGTRARNGEISAHAWVRVGTVDLDASATEHLTFE